MGPLRQPDFLAALEAMHPGTLDGLRTARNLVKSGGGGACRDVEKYLRRNRLY